MTINITGHREKTWRRVNRKAIYFLFGVFQMKNKEKKMLHRFVGTLDMLIYLPYLWGHMISKNKEWD